MTDDQICERIVPILEQARRRVTHAASAQVDRRTEGNSSDWRFQDEDGRESNNYDKFHWISSGDKNLYLPIPSGLCGRRLRALANALTHERCDASTCFRRSAHD